MRTRAVPFDESQTVSQASQLRSVVVRPSVKSRGPAVSRWTASITCYALCVLGLLDRVSHVGVVLSTLK